MILRKRKMYGVASMGIVLALMAAMVIGIVSAPVGATVSGGSGGAFTWRTNQPFSAAGFSSTYHIDASGIDATKPIGLVVDFHGDGAYGYNNPDSSYQLGGPDGIRAVARQYNMITVSALTPDRQTNDLTWWYRGADYADYVQALITHIYGQYNIDKSHVWLVGFSGGAQFIGQYYLPEFGGSGLIEGGGALMFGGGDDPTGGDPQLGTINPIPASFKQNYALYWGAGTADSADNTGWEGGYKSAQDGVAWYGAQGFSNLTAYYPAGWCHSTTSTCTSFESKFGYHLRQQLQVAYPEGNLTSPVSNPSAPQITIAASQTTANQGSVVQLTANANDDTGIIRVEFYQGATKLGEDTAAPYGYSWNTAGLAAGTYPLTAKAYDVDGNYARSTAVSVTLKKDYQLSYTYQVTRKSVSMSINTLTTVQKATLTVSRYPFSDPRSTTDYNYTYGLLGGDGHVNLTLNGLRSVTKYYYKIDLDGTVVGTGEFVTK